MVNEIRKLYLQKENPDPQTHIQIIYDENLIRYDGNTEEHHHLKCSDSGVLIDTNIKSNFDEKDIVSKYNFKPEKTKFFIIGKCNKHK